MDHPWTLVSLAGHRYAGRIVNLSRIERSGALILFYLGRTTVTADSTNTATIPDDTATSP